MPSRTTSTKPVSPRSLVRGMAALASSLREALEKCLAASRNRALQQARLSLSTELGRDVDESEAADVLAQAIACARPILAASPRAHEVGEWLQTNSPLWERWVIERALAPDASTVSSPPLPLSPPLTTAAHLYEPFLHLHHRDQRRRRGVFFTPQPIADNIVRRVDRVLREQCGLPDGLATASALAAGHAALPLIIDPAAGTGVFLLAAIDHVFRTLDGKWLGEACDDQERASRWNAFVPQFLDRLVGIEILPAAALLAKLNIALKLAETGYRFQHDARINILCADALDPATQTEIQNPKSKIQNRVPVLLGNPPFSSLSPHTNPWIARLVRGDDEIRGYVRANGQHLGERKTWLHDEYVKFLRVAQWHVEEAGCGIVGFVTNRGYLDNATFRLMRQELLRIFPHVEIVDLHGSRKAGDVAPDGSRDENVFGLDQGVAIGLFCRAGEGSGLRVQGSGVESSVRRVEYVEAWGTRDAKLAALGDPSLARRSYVLAPSPPQWRLVPTKSVPWQPEYDAAWSLTAAMPVNTTAPVTARDAFVVAFTREELCRRIAEFRDLSIPDDLVRRRYFQRTRSSRYERGDTRGWKLSAARRAVAADDDWESRIVRCLYRPFDWRWVFWHPAMIDWPRTEVTRHLVQESGVRSGDRRQGTGNEGCDTDCSSLAPSPQSLAPLLRPQPLVPLCLITRRQQLSSQPCTFFWISDGLALDGVIRSDNRGSESLFPLYVFGGERESRAARANFAPRFVEAVAAAANLAWEPLRRGDLHSTFGPEDLLSYIYGLFHVPSYRLRHAESLRLDFPRVLLPRDRATFLALSRAGSELIGVHLLQAPLLCATSSPAAIPPEFAAFRAGGYVPAHKWLQPPHRSATDHAYRQVIAAIGRTLEIMRGLDEAVA